MCIRDRQRTPPPTFSTTGLIQSRSVYANGFASSSRRLFAVNWTRCLHPTYGRAKNDDACPAGIVGHRHGSRTRSLTGSFGKTEITVPRARLQTSEGGTTEWHSRALRIYQRRTLTADALIAGAYLAGTN